MAQKNASSLRSRSLRSIAHSQTYTRAASPPKFASVVASSLLAIWYDYADKVVHRHEQTFPKHKSDRLALFKATRAYCEQIYMLYSDPAFTAEELIFGAGKAWKWTYPAGRPRHHG